MDPEMYLAELRAASEHPAAATAELTEALTTALQTVRGRAPVKDQLSSLLAATDRATTAEAAYRDALASIPAAGAQVQTLQAQHAAQIAQIEARHAAEVQALQAAGGGDTMALIAQTAIAERQRWATVMQSDAAKGRENLAITLLAQPSLPADAVLAALDAAPEAAARNPFAAYMAATNVSLPSPQTSAGPVNSREAREAEIASRPKIKVS